MKLTTIQFLAQAAPAPNTTKPPDPGMHMIVMMGFAFALIYFISIRPQQKRQKTLAAQVASTKTGDKVITGSGIHGMIANVKERTFILKIAENVKIEIEKSAVTTVLKSGDEEPEAPTA